MTMEHVFCNRIAGVLTVACLLLALAGGEAGARERKTGTRGSDVKRIAPGASDSSSSPKVGFVDYRLLLLEHPLMKRFDPDSRRFRKTASSFAPDLEAFRSECAEELQSVRSHLKALETQARPVLRGGGTGAREVYELYWKKRAFLQGEETVLQQAIASGTVTGNYHIGMTAPDSLIPVIAQINRQLGEVVEDLKQRHRLDFILDIAGFAAETAMEEPVAVRVENLHTALWDGKPVEVGQVAAWKRDAWSVLPAVRGGHSPIVAGALDLRAESVALLRAWSDPSLDGK